MQSPCGVSRDPECQFLATRRCKFIFRAHAHDLGVIAVGNDQSGFGGQKLAWKRIIHRPEKAIAPVQIALPFLVSLEISAAGFAFNNPNLSLRTQCNDIDAKSAFGHEFFHRHKIVAEQVAANTVGQKLAGLQIIGHGASVNNS